MLVMNFFHLPAVLACLTLTIFKWQGVTLTCEIPLYILGNSAREVVNLFVLMQSG